MRDIYSEIEIKSSPEQVWHILTDFPSFPEWNPFIRKAEGELRVGKHLEVKLKPPKGMGMTLKPKILTIRPNQELSWLGHLYIPWLFDGRRIFTIIHLDENRVLFVQREKFTGILFPVFWLIGVTKNALGGFEAMNKALRERAEQEPVSLNK